MITRHLLAMCSLGMLSVFLVLGSHLMLERSAAAPVPQLEWVFIPSAAAEGAPFAAWYKAAAVSEVSAAWLQLRICAPDGECVLGARKFLENDGVGLVTATRNLVPEKYAVDLLVLRRDAFGVPRTVETVSSEVEYGR